MNKGFLISTVTALALGYMAKFAVDGIAEAATIPQIRPYDIAKKLGVGAQTTWESFLTAQLCGQFTTDYGADAGTCDVAAFKATPGGIRIYWLESESKWVAHGQINVVGTWTPGAPQ